MHKLLILDDAQLTVLLKNPDIVGRFPFMRGAAQAVQQAPSAKAGCGSCGGNRREAAGSINLSGIRAAIDSMNPADKAAFKSMIGAERVRLYYTGHRGAPHKSTF